MTPPTARPRRRTPLLALLGAALLGVLAVGALADSFTWQDEMAAAAAAAVDGEAPLGEPVASGNAACFDVCRGVQVEYRTATTAPVTIRRVARRLEAAGFHDITSDCSRNVWCSVYATRDGLVVSASQYEEESPYDLEMRRVLTVNVGEED